MCLRSYLLLLSVRCYFHCQNVCHFLPFVATEFTADSVSVYWLLIVFVVAAGFTHGSASSVVIVFMCMSSFGSFWQFVLDSCHFVFRLMLCILCVSCSSVCL